MRLFIAVNFPENVKDQLSRITFILRKGSESGNFVPRENFHLTLAFLGETPEDRIDCLKEAMEQVRSNHFNLTISGLGKFNNHGGDIYWMGISDNPELGSIRSDLTGELKARGFVLDNKDFRPHLTLGRRVILQENFAIEKFRETLPEITVPVKAISLMKSDRQQRGVEYTEIHSVFL